ncbi:TrmH family RNA methyltransferase [Alteromonas sediminis]|uniref:TrmH family RNA methyltransferase n=1 Tax=Alteromonas sediminis TaxID=2259342 RepID=A0A3N5YNH7_9ALTE|nr:RNA methyltransferase [Alteromonas sediminis]RPJ67171.1 TrmH family RNA methyltransferase [Alteromonas sediminis]
MSINTVSIGLINPKSATNVGAILRACGCFGGSSVFYTGQRFRYAKDFHSDTKNAHLHIPHIGVDDLLSMAPAGASTIAIELVEGATPLPAYSHPENAFYIFGPEDGSVSQTVIDDVDDVVYIPTANSLNLAATVNVVLYDRLAKSHYMHSDDAIKQSRDNNNNLRRTNKD